MSRALIHSVIVLGGRQANCLACSSRKPVSFSKAQLSKLMVELTDDDNDALSVRSSVNSSVGFTACFTVNGIFAGADRPFAGADCGCGDEVPVCAGADCPCNCEACNLMRKEKMLVCNAFAIARRKSR